MAKKKAKQKAKKLEAAKPETACVKITGKNPVMGLNGQWVNPGEEMECSLATANKLIGIGIAEPVEPGLDLDDTG